MRRSGKSTLYKYDEKGNEHISLQWRKEEGLHDPQELAVQIKEALEEVKVPVLSPDSAKPVDNKDLLYVYPVGDHHLGMLSWAKETGVNYNIKISVDLLEKSFSYLTKDVKRGATALVVFLGDFLHFDSLEAVTPKNKNILDSDSRFPLIVKSATKLMVGTIDMCRKRHARVHVIVEQGNHDPASAIHLRESLYSYYSRTKTVTVDDNPGVYHYYKFGKNLIGTHHGDKVSTLKNLPQVMAAQRAKDWGDTEFRTFITGHNHQDRVFDLPGCRVESVRILPPADAYAYEKGYMPCQEMKRLTMHREYGEIGRKLVKPNMLTLEEN